MARDVKTIEEDLAKVRAEATKLISDGLHFTADFESLITRNKILRDEKYILTHPKKSE